MAKKQFKTESKKLLDMMINSIYTHKEIFLRELISNASDAMDKLYFRSLTDDSITLKHDDYVIWLTADKNARTIVIKDNGCGMTKDELENNLGTIAKSGSYDFKQDNAQDKSDKAGDAKAEEVKAEAAAAAEGTEEAKPDIDIIGQFGVGFYSAFMVSDLITVDSRPYGSEEAYRWQSAGLDGYTIDPCEKADYGTTITLHIKDDTDEESYSEFLDEWKIRELVKKYSDYIHYPIKMMVTKSRKKEDSPEDKPEYEDYEEEETLNSMVPLWKRPASQVTSEEYNTFYREKFYDYEEPVKVIRQKSEGMPEYDALLFIPSHAPYNYYTKDYEKGLELYSSGVMIMQHCKDLLPDYFGFVKGIVDSDDLSLNISRETLQHDRQLKRIANGIEKKIVSELKKLLESDRETYKKFFAAFGVQLKYGVYENYGMNKDTLQDLIMFKSSFDGSEVTLKEYVSRMPESQKKIYYAPGTNVDQIALLPQVEAVVGHGQEVLYLTDDVDEFALQMLRTYDDKEFSNVCTDDLDISTDEEKEALKKENDDSAQMLDFIKTALDGKVNAVKFTNTLKDHPAAISSEGSLSVGMEKTLNSMPGSDKSLKAQLVLDINMNHPIAAKLKELYAGDQDRLTEYAKLLYSNARLISGMELENPAEYGELVTKMMMQ